MSKQSKAYDAIVRARTVLLVSNGFFGCLALHLNLVEVTNKGFCDTMAVDGVNLYYWPEFVLGLSEQELTAVVAHECMHCFPTGTFVAGDNKPIEDYKKGQIVIDQNGQPAHIIETSKRRFKGELCVLKAKGMLPVEATPEHPFLVRQPKWVTLENPKPRSQVRQWSEARWVKARALQSGDWVAVPQLKGGKQARLLKFEYSNEWSVPQQIRNGVKLDPELAEFIGWYVAEGWSLTTKAGAVICGLSLGPKERPIAEKLVALIAKRLGARAKIKKPSDGQGWSVIFGSAAFGRWAQRHCGSGAKNKMIPEAILETSDLAILQGFLKGYIGGDGHVSKTAMHFGTASRTLALQLQLAFARFGFLFGLHERKPTTSVIRGNTIHSGPLYHGYLSNAKLLELFGYKSTSKRSTRHSEVVDGVIFVPVRTVSKRSFEGDVFNFETSAQTYTAGNLIVHNCAYKHFQRIQLRNPVRWNHAGDFVINADLVKAGFTLPGKPITLKSPPGTKGHLLDPKFDGMSTEEVYARLPEPPVIYVTFSGKGDGKDGQGQGHGQGLPKDADKGGCGGVIIPQGGSAEAEKAAREWEANVRMAVNVATAQNAGTVPGYLDRLVTQLKRPKVNWRDLTRQFIDGYMTKDYSWSKPNRRFISSGLYLPGYIPDALHHLIMVGDVSGSITDEIMRAYVSEVAGALDDGTCDKLTAVYVDTEIKAVDEFLPGDRVTCKVKGGGGTDFRPAFDWVMKEAPEASCMVYLTDMMPCSWNLPEPGIPVLWAAYAPEAFLKTVKVPFGQVVWVDSA